MNNIRHKPVAGSGFTLVELSIVLVIIGLVIGGILFGQDLIKSAELRKLYNEKERIAVAVNAFNLKYHCLPGDCSNATGFFGTDPEGCPGPVNNKKPKTQTCDGNGNGIIFAQEKLLLWQHLGAAGLVPGIYSGSNNSLVPNSPSTQPVIDGFNYWEVQSFNRVPSGYQLGNIFGNRHALYSYSIDLFKGHEILTPKEALYLDNKFDDGKPASGSIQVFSNGLLSGCTNPSVSPSPNAVYDTVRTEKNCGLVFLNLGF